MKSIKIEGMHCQNCVKAVKKGLEELNPKSLNVEIGKADIESEASDELLKETIENLGFDVISID